MSDDWLKAIHKEIGENDANQSVSSWLSTGYLPLNKIMSGRYDGGFPVGRMTEVFGASSSGKTIMCVMAGIETQKRDGLFVFLDYEHAFYMEYAQTLGLDVNPSKWIYKQPNTAEEGFKIIEFICNHVRKEGIAKPVTIVLDSVASMVPKDTLEAGFDGLNMKTKLSLASLASACLPSITSIISKTNTTLLCINQTRDNPGVLYGEKTTTPGGHAWKFYSSMRVKLTKGAKVTEANETSDKAIIGENVTVSIVKNKTAPPLQTCKYISSFQEGINFYASHINALHEMGLLGNKRGWFTLDGKKYRSKDFEEACREDVNLYISLLKLFGKTKEELFPEETTTKDSADE